MSLAKSEGRELWIATRGQYDVRCKGTLKGISEEIGASYSTMKSKASKADMFTIVVEGMEVWFVIKKTVEKIKGRGDEERFKKETKF